MRDRISIEHNNAVSNYNLFLDKPLNDAKAILDKLSNEYIDTASERFKSLFFKYSDLNSKLKNNKNTVVQINNEFINLSMVDLFSINYHLLSLNIENKQTLAEATNNLKQLFANKGFKSFILGSIDNRSMTACFTNDSILEYSDVVITTSCFCKLFSSSVVSDNLQSLKDIASNSVKIVENIKNKYSKDVVIDNFEQVNSFLIENNNDIQTMIKSVQTICSIVLHINNLTLNADPILDFYSKL
jgi:hypothetical protein